MFQGIRICTSISLASFAVACSSSPPPPPAAPAAGSAAPSAQTTQAQYPDKDPSQGNINISEDIRSACGLSDTETYFAYNSARVSGEARAILQKLADCFTSGPLAGQSMRLVGHADPRGDSEYNMVLGGKRSDNVKKLLTDLGLKADRVETSSRGELDAQGTDEAGWARDRRVDIVKG